MSIEEKRIMLSVRNQMVDIKSNFKGGQRETMQHIWHNKFVYDGENQKENYEQIFNGNLTQQESMKNLIENLKGTI